MKTLLKVLKWSTVVVLAISCFSILGFMVYLETSFDKTMSEERREWFIQWMEEQPALPEDFIQTIEKYYPGYFDVGFWESLIHKYVFKKSDHCPCREIYIHPGIVGWQSIRFYHHIVALELEEHYGQRRCYEIEMGITVFDGLTRGVSVAARIFYGKELNQLSEREILELHLMRTGLSHYNPKYNQHHLDSVINPLINSLENLNDLDENVN